MVPANAKRSLGRAALLVACVLLALASPAHAAGRWGPERTVFAPRPENGFGVGVTLMPNGDAIAANRRTDVALAESTDRGEFRRLGRLRDPHLVGLTSERSGALTALFAGNGGGLWVRPRRPDGTFGPAQMLDSQPNTLINGPALVESPTAEVVAMWESTSAFCGCLTRLRVSVRPAGRKRFRPAQFLSPADRSINNPTLAFDRAGNALVAWNQEHDTSRGRLAYALRPAGADEFGPTRTLVAAGAHGTVYWLALAANHDGRAVAVWVTRADPLRDVRAAFGTVAGGFRKVERVYDGRATMPHVAIERGGEAVATWIARSPTYAVAAPGGPFGEPRVLEHGRSTSPTLADDGAGTFTFVWRRRPGGALHAARRPVRSAAAPRVVELAPERVWRSTLAVTAAHETLVAWNLRERGDREHLRGARAVAAAAHHGFEHPLDLRTGPLGLRFPDTRVEIATDAVGGAFVWWRYETHHGRGFAGRFRLPR